MKVYAIKHKPTDEWMPHRVFKSARGWSYWEPGLKGYEPHDPNPRIFFTRKAAENSLTMWLQGCWEEQISKGSYFDGPEHEGIAPTNPKQERRREDMEIVELDLLGA